MRLTARFLTLLVLLATSAVVLAQDAAEPVSVPAALETEGSPEDNANSAKIWIHPESPILSAIIAADEDGGIVVYDLEGRLREYLQEGEVTNVDLRYNFPFDGEQITLMSAVNQTDNTFSLYQLSEGDPVDIDKLATFETDFEVISSTCMYRSPITDTYYVFILSEAGEMLQYEVFDNGAGEIAVELARAVQIGSEAEGCAADDENAAIYIAEEDVALFRYGGEPESQSSRRVVDYIGSEGNVQESLEGVSIYKTSGREGYIVAANETANNFLVYERTGDNNFIGAFEITATDTIDGVQEPNGFIISSFAFPPLYPNGILVTTDDNNTMPNEPGNFKIVDWAEIAAALDLTIDTAYDPRQVGLVEMETAASDLVPAVQATVQTTPVESFVDAADDPAVWIHPEDSNLSLVIGSDKTSGIGAYNLDGTLHQFVEVGRINNVDVRYNFPLGGETVDLVAGSNRVDDTIPFYGVDPETRELELLATIQSGLREVYGFCMYVSPATGDYYFFVNSTREGTVEQWRLFDDNGTLNAELARSFVLGSQTEGCAADDELGIVYIGEEQVGFWKFDAEPDGGDEGVLVDRLVRDGGNITPDTEGIAIYYGPNGTGYIIVSSQGSDDFNVYRREGDHEFLGKFQISEGDFTDGVSETDGIDVTNFPLGSAFPNGVFIAQDDIKINPDGNQNFKLVPWEAIAETLGLMIDTGYNPRGE